MVDEIGSEDFVSAQDSPGNNPYMMQGYVKGYPLNALWGFKYAGVWHSVDEFNRNKITKAYAPPSTLNDGNIAGNLGTPRYYDINRDGVLSQDDLVYLGNADPILYGGLQNNFAGATSVWVFTSHTLSEARFTTIRRFICRAASPTSTAICSTHGILCVIPSLTTRVRELSMLMFPPTSWFMMRPICV